ncbi:MAG: peptidase [Thermoplasmatales archaeon B_DKE]|nr:MAG: peptidase [Thermoplasmatales archaeon B_DKE]
MPGELIDRIVSYTSGISRFSDARFMSVGSKGIAYRNGEFEGMESSETSGYAIRMVNESMAFAYTDSEDWTDIKAKIDLLLPKTRRPGKNRISETDPVRASWKVDQKKKIEDMSVEERIEIARGHDRLLDDLGATVRMNFIGDKKILQSYRDSGGTAIDAEISRVSYYYVFGVFENGQFEQSTGQFGSTSGYEYLDSLKLEDRLRSEVKALRENLSAPSLKPGKYDLIVGPEISGIVAHESCGHPTEYDRIIGREGALAGESFLTGKEFPYRVGSDAVSIIDDPTMPMSYGFYEYDDEGIRARKRYLYRKGYTDEFILNRESAAILGVEPNGGGRSSSWNMEPLARMSTTYIEPGDHEVEELFEGVKSGVYMKSFTEWNIDDIRFNEKYVGKESYLVENGQIKGRVRRPTIETNTIKFYSSIDAVAKDLEFTAGSCGKGEPMQGVDVWMGGPHARLRDIYLK